MPPRDDNPQIPDPLLSNIFDGTAAGEVIRSGDTDADGDTVGNDGSAIDAGGGNDTVYAGYGDDTVGGGAGDDWLFGGDGNDLMGGGADNDTLWGDLGEDTLYGNDGDDKLIGGGGNDLLIGGPGNDLLIGDNNPGDHGGLSPEDQPEAAYGNDTLMLSSGNDTAWGGSGDDIFEIYDAFGNHEIVGGETGEVGGDTIDGSYVTSDLNVILTGDEMGTISDGAATINFAEIERTDLGSGDDTVQVLTSTTGT
ncbi:MAG TPA: calcium-binding protein, partial [Pararhodobacter sp.]|uniref:calcium-binding protein n=1 Tax=Pararhodobacter sp. TaxID=2127056 RepID=UPI002C81D518